TLAGLGVTRFAEVGPAGVLSAMTRDCIDSTVVPMLRGDEAADVLRAVATLHVTGATVPWRRIVPKADPVGLPTYAFQRERFWPAFSFAALGDVTAAGLDRADHPLLGAAVPLAESDGLLCTGRLSLRTHPWLADHVIAGSTLFPGTAYVELALRAAEGIGAGGVDELVIETPLVVPERDGVQIQVVVGAATATGRPVTIHSRTEPGEPWTRHATGSLGPAGQEPEPISEWPPPGAEPIDLTGLYDSGPDSAFGYGPAFQGLTAAWRCGEEVHADVTLRPDEHADATRFGLHPALLDASLHVLGTASSWAGRGCVPFSWTGVTLHASGANKVRVTVTPNGTDTVALRLSDPAGRPVASVRALVLRPVVAGAVRHDSLFRLEWPPLADVRTPDPAGLRWAVVGADDLKVGAALDEAGVHLESYADLDSLGGAVELGMAVPAAVLVSRTGPGGPTPGAVREVLHDTLRLVRDWLADERFATSRLVLVTRGAVAALPGEDVDDLACAPLWGLVRSAQSENPGRLLLVDLDDHEASYRALTAAVGDEPQVVLRAGTVRAGRLVGFAAPCRTLIPLVTALCC
ncbi:MAG TPA: polyketide synthase dehydratase domain-containing protein, partial [Pseudonocardiaceae bacterium]|nr:polyketide synthase dehydratase domain-containing protein [Pseudonocardiaceae bacterium]